MLMKSKSRCPEYLVQILILLWFLFSPVVKLLKISRKTHCFVDYVHTCTCTYPFAACRFEFGIIKSKFDWNSF